MARLAAVRFALTSCLLIALQGTTLVHARSTPEAALASTPVRVAELPRQGRETFERIRMGGPFEYEKDGSVFGNRERLLPAHPRGYYREYTVKTPGSRDRGARRIVCGGPKKEPHACYYTADHYASFRKIVE